MEVFKNHPPSTRFGVFWISIFLIVLSPNHHAQLMLNWWLGWWFGFLGSPYERGFLLKGIPRIPNNRAPNHQLTIS